MQIAILTFILLATVGLLTTQIIRIELTSILLIVALWAGGLLTPAEALSGVANPVTVTIVAMFMLSAGLVRTGALDYVVRLVARLRIRSTRHLMLVIGLITAVTSAFLNNTAVVILMIPVTLRLCQRNDITPSKLMIPLSYFAILGGTLTLVGTSTNILVDGIYRQHGGEGFTMFEFSSMGFVYLVIGALFLFLLSDRLLPNRKVLSQVLDRHHRRKFVTEIAIAVNSDAVGMQLGDLLSNFTEARILELVRDEDVYFWPPASTKIEGGDMLLLEGSPQTIHLLLEKRGFDLASAVADDQRVKISRIDLVVVEGVVTPNSAFFNQRLQDIGLNRHYGIKVLAIQRMGRHLQARLREMRLQVGDVLLIQGENEALQELESTGNVLLIEGIERTLPFSGKAPLAMAIMMAVVLLAAVTNLPLAMLALSGGAAMMMFRCLRIRDALGALEPAVLLLLAAAIPLGIAMEKTGLAELIAQGVLHLSNEAGPVVLISAIYLVTSILTAFLTNAATAALLVPIVIQLAFDANIDVKPLLVAVTYGASASFFTPIGYQTNLLVMGPGGYFFRDYFKIGIILNVLLWLAATFLIPIFWPLN